MIEALVLDFDGLLYHTEAAAYQAWNEAARRRPRPRAVHRDGSRQAVALEDSPHGIAAAKAAPSPTAG